MTDEEIKDPKFKTWLRSVVTSEYFREYEIHLLRQADKATLQTETSVVVAHGKRLGISSVFESMEDDSKALVNERKKSSRGPQDPDLSDQT